MIKFLILLLLFLQKSYGNPLCPEPQKSIKDFVEKNEDIIRVFMFNGGSSEGNYLIIGSLKKRYPINHQFQFSIKDEEGIWAGHNDVLKEVYWGLGKVDYKTDPVGDKQNCVTLNSKDELDREIAIWKEKEKGKLYVLANDFKLDEVRKEILREDFPKEKNMNHLEVLNFLIGYDSELAKLMIEKGVPLERKEKDESALMAAVWNSEEELVREILNKKPTVNFQLSTNGYTPLILATGTGDLEIVKMLLEAGADPKPLAPFKQNVLCYLGGSRRLRGDKFRSNLKDSLEIAKILLAKGADPNAPCNVIQKDRTPFTTLTEDVFVDIINLFLDNGLILEKSRPQMWLSDRIWELLKKRGYSYDKKSEDELKEYQKLLAEDLDKIENAKLIKLTQGAIRFQDFDRFKKIVDKQKANLTPIFCSSRTYLLKEKKYFKYLLEKGLNPFGICEDKWNKGNERPLILEVIRDCRLGILEKIPAKDLSTIKLSKEDLTEMFAHWDFKRADFSYDCMRTIVYLDKHKADVDKLQLLRRTLELGFASYLDYFIDNKTLDPGVLQASLDLYAEDKSLLPQDGNFESKAIPKDSRNYLFRKIKKMGIVSRAETAKAWPQVLFTPKKKYLICSFENEIPASRIKRDRTPITTIGPCSDLSTDKSRYFELYEEKDGFLAFVSLTPVFYANSENDLTLGSKIYLPPEMLTTPYYLSDGKIHIALSKGGLKEVRIQGDKFSEVGNDEVCNGSENPKVVSTAISTDASSLPEGFNVKNAKVLKSFSTKLSKICGSK